MPIRSLTAATVSASFTPLLAAWLSDAAAASASSASTAAA